MILEILGKEFPDQGNELDSDNDFEFLIAVILSAQTTDAAVNKITPILFEKYEDPLSLSLAKHEDVEKILQPLGLQKAKAKHIIGASKRLVEVYDSVVPKTRKDLMSLPGVGRKTANVMLAVSFNIPAIAVDTHVARIAKRLGYAEADDSVIKVENKLMQVFQEKDWANAHYLLLLFGRYISTASNHEDIYIILEKLKEKHNL